jgi:hypothetical protein
MPALNEENLYRPFIAEDGLEYDDFAAFLCGQPQDTWRNRRIQEHRKNGRSESALRQWIKGYDGDDPRTTSELDGLKSEERVGIKLTRHTRADSAAYVVEPHDDFLPF